MGDAPARRMRFMWLFLITLLAATDTIDSPSSPLRGDAVTGPRIPKPQERFKAWLTRPWSLVLKILIFVCAGVGVLALIGIGEAFWFPGSLSEYLSLIPSLRYDDKSKRAEWWTAYATLGLCGIAIIAAFVGIGQVMLTRKVQRSQTFVEVSQRWNDEKFRITRIEIREIYCRKKEPDDVKKYLLGLARSDNKLQYWLSMEALNFFETIAVLRKQDALAFEVVSKVWGFVIWDYWTMMQTFVQHQREKATPYDPGFCREFEDLAILIAKKHCWEDSEKPGLYK